MNEIRRRRRSLEPGTGESWLAVTERDLLHAEVSNTPKCSEKEETMSPEPMMNDSDRVAPDRRLQLPSPTRRRTAAVVLSLLLALSCFAASPAGAVKLGEGANDTPFVQEYDNVAAYISSPPDEADQDRYPEATTSMKSGSTTLMNVGSGLSFRKGARFSLTDSTEASPCRNNLRRSSTATTPRLLRPGHEARSRARARGAGRALRRGAGVLARLVRGGALPPVAGGVTQVVQRGQFAQTGCQVV